MNFGDASTQGSILTNVSDCRAGDVVQLKDAQGNVLVTYTAESLFNSVVVSCPQLKQGETYTVTAGGSEVKVTLDNLIYGNGMGGFGDPGMSGGRGGMEGDFDGQGDGRGGRDRERGGMGGRSRDEGRKGGQGWQPEVEAPGWPDGEIPQMPEGLMPQVPDGGMPQLPKFLEGDIPQMPDSGSEGSGRL